MEWGFPAEFGFSAERTQERGKEAALSRNSQWGVRNGFSSRGLVGGILLRVLFACGGRSLFLGMGKEGEKGKREEKRRLFIELEIWARVEWFSLVKTILWTSHCMRGIHFSAIVCGLGFALPPEQLPKVQTVPWCPLRKTSTVAQLGGIWWWGLEQL